MATTTHPDTTGHAGHRFGPVTILTALAGLGVAAGGVFHYQIWNSDYRDLPSQVPGAWVVKDGFPINSAVSIVLAIALLAYAFGALGRLALVGRLAVVASGLVELGSIGALVLSRESSIFGWSEKGWDGDAKKVIVTEVVSVVLVAAALVLDLRRSTVTEP